MKQTYYKGYKFRIYPNESQKEMLSQHFGHTRFLYNYFLRERIDKYKEDKIGSTYYRDAARLTSLKSEFEWLKEVNSQSLQQSLKERILNFCRSVRKSVPRNHLSQRMLSRAGEDFRFVTSQSGQLNDFAPPVAGGGNPHLL